MPNGARCDGVDHLVRRKTRGSDEDFDYTYFIGCVRCDVPRMVSKCFGRLDSRPEQAKDIENAILSRLKVKPARNKFNEKAMQVLKDIIVSPNDRKSAVLMGPVGTGKTFLAQHTLKAIMHKHKKPCLYAQEHTLLHAWRFSQDKTKSVTATWGGNFLHAAKTCEYLLIDDFGASRRTSDGALDALEEIIMVRYDAGKPMIVTTNMSPEDLEMRRGSRVWSRLKGMARENVIEIKGGDFRKEVRWEV